MFFPGHALTLAQNLDDLNLRLQSLILVFNRFNILLENRVVSVSWPFLLNGLSSYDRGKKALPLFLDVKSEGIVDQVLRAMGPPRECQRVIRVSWGFEKTRPRTRSPSLSDWQKNKLKSDLTSEPWLTVHPGAVAKTPQVALYSPPP